MSRNVERLLYAIVAAAIGWVYWALLTMFWAHWVIHNPIAAAMLSPGDVFPHYRWVLYPTDWLTSVLLSLPFAALAVWPGRKHMVLCIAVASLVSLTNVSWSGVVSLPPTVFPAMAFGILLPLTFLPAAAAILLLVRRRFAPNNSFKPTPLRGAA